MDDMDLGVALSVTSLVMALAQDNLEQYKGAYVKAAARLKRILVDGECSPDYLYYKVPFLDPGQAVENPPVFPTIRYGPMPTSSRDAGESNPQQRTLTYAA